MPAKRKGQKPILFGRIKSELVTHESSEDDPESPQFFDYELNAYHMMEIVGYDLTKRSGLNFGQGRRARLLFFIPKGKGPDYYYQTRRGLGYMSTPIPSGSKSEESLYYDHSSASSLESDINIDAIFEDLSDNIVSTSHLEDEDEDEEII